MMDMPYTDKHSKLPNEAVVVAVVDPVEEGVDVRDVVADVDAVVLVVGVDVWVVEVTVVDGVLVTVVLVVSVVVCDDVALLVGLEVPLLVGVVTRHPSNALERNASAIAFNVESVSSQLLIMYRRSPNAQITSGSLSTALLSSSRNSLIMVINNAAVAWHCSGLSAVSTGAANPKAGTSHRTDSSSSPSARLCTALH